MSVTTSSAIRNKFIVDAQTNSGMTLDEANELADFFESIGDHLFKTVTPALNAYRLKMKQKIENDILDEAVRRLQGQPSLIRKVTAITIVQDLKTYEND